MLFPVEQVVSSEETASVIGPTTCVLFIDTLLTNTRFSHKIPRINWCDNAFMILLQCMTGIYLGYNSKLL